MNDSEPTVAPSRASLQLAAIGGLVFVTFYLLHRILQGAGPADSSAAVVAAYNVEHHNALLASEIAVGFALLAFIAFLAPLVPVLWRTGQETVAVSVLAAGLLVVAMGFVSTGAETALVAVADTGEPAAVSALNQLQGRVPVVLAIAAFAATIATTTYRTRLWWRWLGHASVVAAVVFLLGFVFSVLGSTPEERSSGYGIAAFIVWMLLLTAGLWRGGTAKS